MGKVIAIANQKGGVGKTLCTVHLAGALNALSRDVLVIDADPQGVLTKSIGFRNYYDGIVPDYMGRDVCFDHGLSESDADTLIEEDTVPKLAPDYPLKDGEIQSALAESQVVSAAGGVDPETRRRALRAVVRSEDVWKGLDTGSANARQVARDVISDVTGDTA